MWHPALLIYKLIQICLNTLWWKQEMWMYWKGKKKQTQRINEFFWRYNFWIAEDLALSSLTIKGLTLTDRLFKPLCFTPFPASLHMRHYAHHLFYWPLGHVLLWEAIHPWYKWPGLLCGWGSWCSFQNLKIILTHRPELWLLPMVSFSSAVSNWRRYREPDVL